MHPIASQWTTHRPLFLHFVLLFIIFVVAILLRLYSYHGYGLGDDPNFFSAAFTIWKTMRIPHEFGGYWYRFGLWLPLLTSFKLFGATEAAFILPIILADLLCILVVYFIGKILEGPLTGLMAAFFLAISPFNIAFASSFSPDFLLALCLSLVMLFRALGHGRDRSACWLVLAAFSLSYGFYVNAKAIYILPGLFWLTLIQTVENPRTWLKESVFWGSALMLFSAGIFFDYYFTGDPLGYFHTERKIMYFLPLKDNLMEYPRLMFTSQPFGIRLCGFYFWFCFPLLLFSLWISPGSSSPCQFSIWILGYFLCLSFFSSNFFSPDFSFDRFTEPRIFRYLAVFFPPVSLLLAYWFTKALSSFGGLMWIALSVFLIFNSVHVFQVASYAHDAQSDPRFVRDYLRTLPERPIYLDSDLLLGVERFNFQFTRPWLLRLLKRTTPLESIGPGYAISGGSRNPFYGCMHCRFDLGNRKPPANWRLLATVSKPIKPYREEPLRIWEIHPPPDDIEEK